MPFLFIAVGFYYVAEILFIEPKKASIERTRKANPGGVVTKTAVDPFAACAPENHKKNGGIRGDKTSLGTHAPLRSIKWFF